MNEQHIACPNCQNDILFDVHTLLQGKSFSCSNCDAKIQLSVESQSKGSDLLNEFNKIKMNSLKGS